MLCIHLYIYNVIFVQYYTVKQNAGRVQEKIWPHSYKAQIQKKGKNYNKIHLIRNNLKV